MQNSQFFVQVGIPISSCDRMDVYQVCSKIFAIQFSHSWFVSSAKMYFLTWVSNVHIHSLHTNWSSNQSLHLYYGWKSLQENEELKEELQKLAAKVIIVRKKLKVKLAGKGNYCEIKSESETFCKGQVWKLNLLKR